MVAIHRVVWRDAAGGSNTGWRSLSELKDQSVATVISCGVIIHEDEEKIIICPHVIVEDDRVVEGDAEIAIPKDWIISSMKMATFPPGD